MHNVGSWIPYWAATAGSRLAIADAERRLDYAALDDRVARLAGWLRSQGVDAGDRVAILLPNCSPYLETVFAAARIGAIALPINSRLSAREICFLFDDCRPAALVHSAELSEVCDKACTAAASPPRARLCVRSATFVGDGDASPDYPDYERALAAATPEREVVPASPEDPTMLMYTSGTTGAPKGAILPHRKTLYNSLNAQLFFGVRADDRVLVVAPLFHSLGIKILSLPVLYAGGSLILQPRFEPADVWRCIEEERITYFGGVPQMYQRLWEWLEATPTAPDLSSLRFLFTAGSAIPIELILAFEKLGLVLKQGFGQTETSILTCLEGEDAVRKAGSVGRPVRHAEVRVVAADTLSEPPTRWRDVDVGETGEIVARGPITMLGYWERPEATAETLRDGWVRTNDLARLDEEGFVTLVGRSRDMYISGGENVYPAEVEAAYLEHDAVAEIAVVGLPDARWGEIGCAFVVLARGFTLDAEALAVWGRERLARFKIPAQFVERDALPHTATGKVQKHVLRDQFVGAQEPAASAVAGGRTSDSV